MNKICFLSTWPPHPAHKVFAESIDAEKISLLNKKETRYKGLIKGLFRINFLSKYEVIVSESADLSPLLYIVKKKSSKKKIISIAAETFYHSKYYDTSQIVRKILLWFLKNSVDGFIAVSKYMKNIVREQFPDISIEVAYPPITKEPSERTSLKEKNILFIGNNRKSKGYMELIEAFEILREKYKDIKLYLVGDCYKDIDKKVEGMYVEGRVPNLDIYFKRCSIYVHPAYIDPCPVSVSEAMYAGLLTILTDKVGQAELLKKKGLDNYIVNSNKPEILAEKIEEVISQDISKKKKDSKKFMEIARLLTKEVCAKRFKKVFFKLLHNVK